MVDYYVGIDDAVGHGIWSDVSDTVIKWVTVEEHDQLIESGYIDQDGKVLVEVEFSDD